MSKCPNCGLETLRTEDWACQWCGYPLPSGPFRKIEKTYRQLKDEREGRAGTVQQNELEQKIELKQNLETIKALNLEIKTGEKTEKEAEPEIVETEAEEETGEAKGEEGELEQGGEETAGRAEELEEESQKEEEVGQIDEPGIEPIKKTEPEPEPKAPDIELSVGELLAAYGEDDVAADEQFVNKILRLNGVVSMIDIKDMLDTHYIRMTDGSKNCLQSLQCMFEKKHAPVLRELEKGHNITVQGRYNGSVIAMRIVDCVLI